MNLTSPVTAAATAQVKLSPYDEEEPHIWFRLIEAQFAAAGIKSQKLKYSNALASLQKYTHSKGAEEVLPHLNSYTPKPVQEFNLSLSVEDTLSYLLGVVVDVELVRGAGRPLAAWSTAAAG